MSKHSHVMLDGSLIWYRDNGLWRIILNRNGIRPAREHRNSPQINAFYVVIQ